MAMPRSWEKQIAVIFVPMKESGVSILDPATTWIDVTAPSLAELQEVAARYGLPATAVEDSLDPEHLPKYERFNDSVFLILRVYDPLAPGSAGTVQQLTRKIAFFLRGDVGLTVHRVDLPAIAATRERFTGPSAETCGRGCGTGLVGPGCLAIS